MSPRDADCQHIPAVDRLFHSPNIYYRPQELKSLRCILGNSEAKTVYQNFELLNLNTNAFDYSHQLYTRYLQYNRFIPPQDTAYFEHMAYNTLPTDPPSTTANKGLVNIFPLSLTSEELNKSTSSALGYILPSLFQTLNIFTFFPKNLFFPGVITTSPLRIEVELQPVPTVQWHMIYTFLYLNKITFTGSKTHQEINFDILR